MRRLEGNVIDLEGHDLVAVELGHTDRLHDLFKCPLCRPVVDGDAAYNDVHLYLAESNAKSRQEWISALDKIESLNPCAVIAAHKRPGNDDSPRIIEETKEVHMRIRPDSRNDDNRAGDLQQDARDISKSGQSGVGNLEFGACSQTVI